MGALEADKPRKANGRLSSRDKVARHNYQRRLAASSSPDRRHASSSATAKKKQPGAAIVARVLDGFRVKRGLRNNCLLNYDSCTHHEMNAANINESSEAEKRHFYECQQSREMVDMRQNDSQKRFNFLLHISMMKTLNKGRFP